jgi:hypothetical protein
MRLWFPSEDENFLIRRRKKMSTTVEMDMPIDLPIEKVVSRKDARKLDERTIGAIRMSIEEVGLLHPLRVRPTKIETAPNQFVNGWEVTLGRHRLEALKIMGSETVPCIVVDDDDLHAELAMIDENLCRAELSAAERARSIARKKQLYDIINGIAVETEPEPAAESSAEPVQDQIRSLEGQNACWVPDESEIIHEVSEAQTQASDTSVDNNVDTFFKIESDVPPPPRDESTEDERDFYKKTAAQTGRSESSIKADHKRGKEIEPDVLATIKGTHLDKGTYLDTLRGLSPGRQRAKVERDLDAEPEPRKKKVNNINKINATRKIAQILFKYVPSGEHDSVEALLEDSDIESLLIQWNKVRESANKEASKK